MKKTIVAAAIAAVVAAPAAMAEVSVYGVAHLDYTTGDSDTGISENSSRIGFKFSEDLGNGMKSFGQFEFGTHAMDGTNGTATLPAAEAATSTKDVTLATNSAYLFNRDAFVGLSGDFGKVMFGRMAGPTKGALYGLGNVQLADSQVDFADGFESKSSSSGYGRVSNVAAYAGSFNGVNVVLAKVGAEKTDNMDSTAFGFDTTIGGIKVGAARTDVEGTGVATVIGAKMSMDALTVGIVRENVDPEGTAADFDTTGVSASYAMGANTLAVSYSDRDTAKDVTRTNISLQHAMSKNTSVYIAHGTVETDGSADVDNTALGMIMKF
jgi:predicted porin